MFNFRKCRMCLRDVKGGRSNKIYCCVNCRINYTNLMHPTGIGYVCPDEKNEVLQRELAWGLRGVAHLRDGKGKLLKINNDDFDEAAIKFTA